MSPIPEIRLKNIKYTKTRIYQNKETLKEIITMNNLKCTRMIRKIIGKL